jgi:hypothetical protein
MAHPPARSAPLTTSPLRATVVRRQHVAAARLQGDPPRGGGGGGTKLRPQGEGQLSLPAVHACMHTAHPGIESITEILLCGESLRCG